MFHPENVSLIALTAALTALAGCGGGDSNDGQKQSDAGAHDSGGRTGSSGGGGNGDGGTGLGDGGNGASGAAQNAGGSSAGGATNSGTGGAPVTTPDVACQAFAAGNDLNVCTATYVGGGGVDEAGGIDLAPDGTVVYGGSLADETYGATPTTLLGGTSGVVMRLSADGRDVLSVTRIGADVNDLAVNLATGSIAVAGDFGVALLDPVAGNVLFSSAVGVGRRVAAGSDGAVAVLADKHVSVFGADGAELGSFDLSDSAVNDIAIDGAARRIFVTGFKQDDGAPCTQLQIPFIRAYGYDGQVAWRAYDWNRAEVGAESECADSRGIAVAMGRDGKLYYAGESHGGNTVHRRDPQDVTTMTQATTNIDKYTDPYNMNGAAPVMFYARFDPATGALENSQRLVVRLTNDKGNAVRPTSIAADEQGNMLIGGSSACCVPEADQKTINGAPAYGAYAGGPFVLVVSQDFTQRLMWTSFRGATGEGGDIESLAAGGGRMAMALTQQFDAEVTVQQPFISIDPLQAAPGGGTSDGYAAVWRAPAP